jgi:hypothetical protein
MITADTSHSFAVKARDGEDSIVGQFLTKLETKIHERSMQGMFWLYVDYAKDDIFSNASLMEIELAKMKLKQLGYAVTEYVTGTWGIAW